MPPPPKTVFGDELHTVELTFDPTGLRVENTQSTAWEFWRACSHFNSQVPLSKLELKRQGPPADKLYQYLITLRDGRKWNQTMKFDVLPDPQMTFAVTDPWRTTEFGPARVVRDWAIRLVGVGCTDINAVWY